MAGSNNSSSVASLLERVLNVLKNKGVLDVDPQHPIIKFKHPSDLKEEPFLRDFGEPVGKEGLEAVVQDVIEYSVKTGHPLFLNQLYGAVDPYGLAAAWVTEALNTNQHTFEVAPVFTLMEEKIVESLLKTVGYKEGDGIFAAGGSMANMYAMVLARYKFSPDVKKAGLSGSAPLAAFVSADSHYSILKAAHWLGIGSDNVYTVDCDVRGCMIPEQLEKHIQEALASGKRPFFVNTTAGTTVLGAFDPYDAIADVCAKYNIWLHIDACWGGALMFSQKYKSAMKGAERSNSISWNPHKMLGAPLQCSIILLKEKGLLHKCNSAAATYLFQQDKYYDTSYDLGDKSVQCGRKPDVFKFWLMWRVRGDAGLSAVVDNAMDKSRYFLEQIRNRDGFRLVLPEFQCTNICFWYIPESLRNQPETEDWWIQVNKVAPMIKEKIVLEGTLMIGYSPLKHRNLPNFFRFVLTCHPVHTEAQLDRVIQEIETAGKHLKIIA